VGGVAEEAKSAVVVSGRGQVMVEGPTNRFGPLGIGLVMWFVCNYNSGFNSEMSYGFGRTERSLTSRSLTNLGSHPSKSSSISSLVTCCVH
jgi:hypothetical protein